MIKNNKGVTLVELLIVIVVMGIIAAFSIPAVGNIIENAQKEAILQDAIQVENAAKWYCSSTIIDSDCDVDATGLDWATLEPYVDGLDEDYYVLDDGGAGDAVVAKHTDDGWTVNLAATDDDDWDFDHNSWLVPSTASRDDVTPAAE